MHIAKIRQFCARLSNAFQEKQLSLASLVLLSLSGILQFIFSLSHSIALRKLCLAIAFLIAFKWFWQAIQKKSKPLLIIFVVFFILQLWMLFIAAAVSTHPIDSISEWKGQWLPVFFAFVVGIGLARALAVSKLKDLLAVITMSIVIPITLYLLLNAIVILGDWISAGKFLPSLGGIGDHHGISGYLVALLMPILMVDLLNRLVKGKKILPVPAWASLAIYMLVIGTLVGTTNRNGLVSTIMTMILVIALMAPEIRKAYSLNKIIAFILATLTCVSAMAFVSYVIDSRWSNVIETIPVAWDIDRDLAWLNGDGTDLPLSQDGEQVDVSLYSRIAWAHEGWRMLKTHPWGIEIARDTFHKLEVAKYGHAGMAHSHNSWIDFGLEVGIPGLLLWGGMLALLARFGWIAWRTDKEPLGLALGVLVIMFVVRGLMDSIFRDHEVVQFMLVASLLTGALASRKADLPQP